MSLQSEKISTWYNRKKKKKPPFLKTAKGISEQGLVKHFNQNLKTNSIL